MLVRRGRPGAGLRDVLVTLREPGRRPLGRLRARARARGSIAQTSRPGVKPQVPAASRAAAGRPTA